MRTLAARAWEALKYAAARGRRAIGATLGAATGQAVTRIADEWFDVTVDASVATVIAIGLAGFGAWITKENAPKNEETV